MKTPEPMFDANRCGFDSNRLAAIPGEMQRFVDSGDLSGMVTLIWRRGAIAHVERARVRATSAEGLPMQRDTLFRIASMTKPVTSVAALMLMEEGTLEARRSDQALDAGVRECSGVEEPQRPRRGDGAGRS